MSIEARDRPVTRLLLAHQNAEPDAFVETLATAVAGIGGRDVVLFLVDYAHVVLTPHPDVLPHGSEPEAASLDGSMAGRAFTSGTALAAEREDGWHVWVPISEQSNRLGVLAMTLPRWDAETEFLCTELGLAAAPLLLASAQYTDLPHLLRRRKDMDLAAEMQWSLLPPLSFAAAGVTIAGLLEPAYQVGGDCFDYAFNAGRLDFCRPRHRRPRLDQRGPRRAARRGVSARPPRGGRPRAAWPRASTQPRERFPVRPLSRPRFSAASRRPAGD